MSRSRSILSVMLLVFLVTAAGCPKKKDKEDKDGKGSSKKVDKPAKVSEADKTNAYIECSNRFQSRAYQAKERYLSWVDAKTGPTGKEKAVFGTYELVGDVAKECREKIDRIAGAEPRMPDLEKAGEALVVSLEKLGPLLEDANAYYGTAKGYQKDDWKHGKELHPTLMAAFDAFVAAEDGMGVQLTAMEDRNLEKQMAAQKDNPDRVPYLITATIFTGKKLIRHVSGKDKIEDVDIVALEAAVVEFETVLIELVEWIKVNKVADGVTNFARTAAPPVAFKSRTLIKHVKTKAKWSSGDKMMIENGNPQMADGHPASVIDAYNDMIESSNRM